MALKEAIEAIYGKVQTDVTNATPEELAYLGTALEKIGGRASVYDILQMTDDKKAELLAYVNDLIANVDLNFETELNNFNGLIDQKTTTALGIIESDYNLTIDQLQTIEGTIVSDTQAAIDAIIVEMEDEKASLLQAAENFGSMTSLANQQALDGSLFNLIYFSMLK